MRPSARSFFRFPAILAPFVLVLVVLTSAIQPARADVAVALPGNRQNYVVTLLAAKQNASFGRLAQWTFNPNGDLKEQYWVWNAAMNLSQGRSLGRWYNHVSVGTTNGCFASCDVWAPIGFQNSPTERTGRWSRSTSADGRELITVVWPKTSSDSAAISETWWVRDLGGLTELVLVSHNYVPVRGANHVIGRAYGSNRNFTSDAKTVDGIIASNLALGAPASFGLTYPNDATKNYYEIQWSETAFEAKRQAKYISTATQTKCSNSSNCFVTTDRSQQQNYHYAKPGTRQLTWYYMYSSMLEPSSPCPPEAKGGHNMATLQVLDDAGNFRGLVGIEASIYGTVSTSNYMSLYVGLG